MDTVAVIISTFGSKDWIHLANSRAKPSAVRQNPTELIMSHHDSSLSEARNLGAAQASTSHLIFLDADDELEDGYVQAMLSAREDLRYPSVRYVSEGEPEPPIEEIPSRNLITGNHIVIGAMMQRKDFSRGRRI